MINESIRQIEPPLDDPIAFSMFLQYYCKEHALTILEGLVKIVNNYNLEEEEVKGLLTQNVKGLLESDGIEAGILKRSITLDEFLEK